MPMLFLVLVLISKPESISISGTPALLARGRARDRSCGRSCRRSRIRRRMGASCRRLPGRLLEASVGSLLHPKDRRPNLDPRDCPPSEMPRLESLADHPCHPVGNLQSRCVVRGRPLSTVSVLCKMLLHSATDVDARSDPPTDLLSQSRTPHGRGRHRLIGGRHLWPCSAL